MNTSRIHACLDGEIPRSALSDDERVRLARLEAAIRTVSDTLRAQPAPELTDAVMRGLPLAPPPWRRALGWLWAPHPVRLTLRPAYAFAGLVILALLLPFGGPPGPGVSDPASKVVDTSGVAPIYVQFMLDAPAASRVVLAGSFTNWRPIHELRETAPGVWSVLVPLEPGVHDYAFIVDGERWVVDPKAPRVPDSFGGVNSRLSLPPPHDAA